MSVDHSATPLFGFFFTYDDIVKTLGKPRPVKFHMEPRYDGKTGKYLGRVKVTDEDEGTDMVLKIDGEVQRFPVEEEFQTFIAGLEESLNCSIVLEGSYQWGEMEDMNYYFTIPDFDFEAATLGKVAALGPRLERLRKAMMKLGFRLGKEKPRMYAPVLES